VGSKISGKPIPPRFRASNNMPGRQLNMRDTNAIWCAGEPNWQAGFLWGVKLPKDSKPRSGKRLEPEHRYHQFTPGG
jgi:hypothetical protein